jgi:hypothetical protein
MIPIFLFNDVALNIFLNQDTSIILTIGILPAIVHGTIAYCIVNNIFIDNTTHLLITKVLFPLVGFN